MIYRCPRCNGALEYNPISDEMECAHCGSGYTMQEISTNQRPEDYYTQQQPVSWGNPQTTTAAWGSESAYSQTHAVEIPEEPNIYAEPETMECRVYTCTSCGAELLVNDTEVSTYCAYCGQPTIVFSRVSNELTPKYILPFKITKEQALSNIRDKFGKGFLIPDEIKNFNVEKMRGIYVPYFLFDAYYYDRQKVSYSEGVGDKKKTKIIDFEAECEFTKLSCDASVRLNDESTQRLEPYCLDELKPFDAGYMSGFYADRYDLTARQLTNAAVRRCKDLFLQQMRKEVRDSNAAVLKSNPRHEIRGSEYALLPVWFMTFRYKNEPYTMLVNGQTGKVVGAVPYNKKKATVLFVIVAVLASSILAGLGCFLHFGLQVELTVFVAILVLGLIFYLIGISLISVYKKNMKLTKLVKTAKFVGERQDDI